MKHWWCAECDAEVGLDRHGRCGICGSEAVDQIFAEDQANRPGTATATDSSKTPVCA